MTELMLLKEQTVIKLIIYLNMLIAIIIILFITFYLYAFDGCHDLMKTSMAFKSVPVATVKENN